MVVQSLDEDSGDDALAIDPVASFQSGALKRKRSTPPAPVARSGNDFAATNRKSTVATTGSDDEPAFDANNIPFGGASSEVDHNEVEDDEDDEDTIVVKPLVPIVSRSRIEHDDDVIDMTAGGDVMRRILEELEGKRGAVVYRVEMGDYGVEEVSCCQLLLVSFESMPVELLSSPLCAGSWIRLASMLVACGDEQEWHTCSAVPLLHSSAPDGANFASLGAGTRLTLYPMRQWRHARNYINSMLALTPSSCTPQIHQFLPLIKHSTKRRKGTQTRERSNKLITNGNRYHSKNY